MYRRNILAVVAAAAALTAALSTSGCGKPPATQALAANAVSGRELIMLGTLCTGGDQSFDCRESPLYTRLGITRIKGGVRYVNGEITQAEGQALLAGTDAIRKLLDEARTTCAMDAKSGKCTGDAGKAEALLKQAQERFGDSPAPVSQ